VLSTDPIDLLLDSSGDLVVDTDAHFASGIAAIAQGIRIALQMFKGEWFLDLDEGVPYLERSGVAADQALIGQKFNEARALSEFRKAILRAPGVNSIVTLKVALDAARLMRVTWAVRTTFGDTPPDTLVLGV